MFIIPIKILIFVHINGTALLLYISQAFQIIHSTMMLILSCNQVFD